MSQHQFGEAYTEARQKEVAHLQELLKRAAELLITEDSPGHEGHRDKLIEQWLRDAGMEGK